jgi:adenylate cyclase
MAVIKDKIIGAQHAAEVNASGEEAVRLRTAVIVAPFDDLMLHVAGKDAFVKVIECDVQEGVCDLFAVYTSVSDDARHALLGVNAPTSSVPRPVVNRIQASSFVSQAAS